MLLLNDDSETLERIESGRSCQILGAAAPKALAHMAVMVRCSQMRLREADRTALPGT